MNGKIERRPSGQVLVLVALALMALFAFVALAIDVGQIYRERRVMQNAADAGALAGAYELCFGDGATQADREADAIDEAEDYATTRNSADGAEVLVNSPLTVTVTASKTVATFFAGLIGFDEVDVDAEATAACGKAEAAGLVWPIGFQDAFPDEPICGSSIVLWQETDANCCGYNCKELYDKHWGWAGTTLNVKSEYDPICGIQDPDHEEYGIYYVPQYQVGQGRTWLDLSAGLLDTIVDPCDSSGIGNDELKYRLEGVNNKGETCISWLDVGEDGICIAGDSGTRSSAWTAAGTRAGDIALIPLYDVEHSYDASQDSPKENQCTMVGADSGDDAGGERFFITGFGCIKIEGPFYFHSFEGHQRVKVIVGTIPCDENGDPDPECSRQLGYTKGEEPDPGDPKAVNLIP